MNDFALGELVEATSRSVKDSLALSDEYGVVLAVNAAYRELYGFTEQEVVGRSFAVIFPEDQRGAAEAAYRRAFQRGGPAIHRSTIRRSNGANRRVESRIVFVERSGGRVAMLSAIRDITVPRPVALAERPLLMSLDLGALASLYDQYVRSALGYAHALLNDVAQAEQVVEDTLLASWRAGLLRERDHSAARLLLFSMLRRYAGEVLLTRVRTARESGAGPSNSRTHERWPLELGR